MNADRLREAAKVLRERAETETILRDGDPYYTTEASAWERVMHPVVGLALADWLDDLADHDASDLMPMERGAFALADLILGGGCPDCTDPVG